MVGASTDIVNKGTLPTLTFGSYEFDTWPITNNYNGTINVHVEVRHYKYGLGEHKQIQLYKSEEAKLAQCLPLHEHLRFRLNIQNCM